MNSRIPKDVFKPREVKFPSLMTNNDCIILFLNPKEGVVVHQGSSIYPVGYYLTDFGADIWTPYKGVVELYND